MLYIICVKYILYINIYIYIYVNILYIYIYIYLYGCIDTCIMLFYVII